MVEPLPNSDLLLQQCIAAHKEFEHSSNASLHAALGMLSLIKSGKAKDKVEEHLALIQKSCEAIRDDIQQLRTAMPVVENGQLQLEPTDVSLAHVLDMLVSLFREAAVTEGIRLERVYHAEPSHYAALHDVFAVFYHCLHAVFSLHPDALKIVLQVSDASPCISFLTENPQELLPDDWDKAVSALLSRLKINESLTQDKHQCELKLQF